MLTGVEAARRTDSAFDRLLATTEAWDVLVNPDDGTESALRMEDIAALPMVEDASRVDGVLLGPRTIDTFAELDTGPTVLASDGRSGYELARPLVREGRLPDPDAVDEIFVSDEAADGLGLDVGDRYPARVMSFEDLAPLETFSSEEEALAAFNDPDLGRAVELTVVGIGSQFDEIVVDEGFGGGNIVVTPAFYDAYDQPSAGYWGSVVRLGSPAELDDFQQAVEALVPEDEAIAFQSRVGVEDQFNRAIGPQVVALWIFTAVAAAMALVLVGQAISRRLQVDAAGLAPLRALGVTHGQLTAIGVSRMALAATAGAVLAVVVAVVASPLAPVGVARDAEPDLGVRVDLPVLVLGGIAVALVFTVLAVRPAYVSARTRHPAATRSGPGTWAAGVGLAPPAVAGVRFALDRSAVGLPARSTLVGAATSVALVVATLAFSSSLNHFVETGELFGTPWDAVIDLESDEDPLPADYQVVTDALVGRDDVSAFGLLYPGQLRVEGRPITAIAIEASERPVTPTMLTGRPPTAPTEVALGATTRDDLDVDIGDEVTVTRGDRSGELTVVGTAVLPAIGSYSGADKTRLGEGALATAAALAEWGPEFTPYGVVVDLTLGTTVDDVVAEIEVPEPLFVTGLPPSVPSDVASLEHVRSTPLLLTGLLAALIALTVIHALATAVRSRRHELAVLRTLGFTRRQVLGAVATQATLIAAVGLLVGVPVGLVVGRIAWTTLADRLGAALVLITPVVGLGLLSAAVLALALAVGLVPGLARRGRPPRRRPRAE